MKTNKSYTKRIKQTKGGKLLTRPKAQNHFRGRKSGTEKMKRRSLAPVGFAKKIKERFLPKK